MVRNGMKYKTVWRQHLLIMLCQAGLMEVLNYGLTGELVSLVTFLVQRMEILKHLKSSLIIIISTVNTSLNTYSLRALLYHLKNKALLFSDLSPLEEFLIWEPSKWELCQKYTVYWFLDHLNHQKSKFNPWCSNRCSKEQLHFFIVYGNILRLGNLGKN